MRVTLVQADLRWEDRDANLEQLQRLISGARPRTDLVVLPEMFSTGFSMRTDPLAEPPDGPALAWMREMARSLDAAVTGSLMVKDGGRCFNRLHWVEPDGSVAIYDKRHLFSFANETEHFSGGAERLVVEFRGWRVCPLVCYDLRFPVWSRNVPLDGTPADSVFDLLVYVANWPEARVRPWKTLLEARAHENQAYVVGVNRVGRDGNGIAYSGDSAAHGPKGDLLSGLEPSVEGIETVSLDLDALSAFRQEFPAWKDRDPFRLL